MKKWIGFYSAVFSFVATSALATLLASGTIKSGQNLFFVVLGLMLASVFALYVLFKSIKLDSYKISALLRRKQKASVAANRFLLQRIIELRRPLQGLNGIHDLYSSSASKLESREYLEIADYCSRFLTRQLERIQMFAEFETQSLLLQSANFSLRKCIEDAIRVSREQSHNKKVIIIDECSDEVPDSVCGSEIGLRKMIVELLDNASRYGGNSRVSLKIMQDSNDAEIIRFTISDSGPGLSDFFVNWLNRKDKGARLDSPSQGLGLALFKKLLISFNGTVEVESRKGLGTSVSFALAKEALYAAEAIPAEEIQIPDRAVHALVVDDERVTRQIIMSFLKKLGLEVHSAENGQEAVQICKTRSFDVIFMDTNMPILDGFDASRVILNELELTELPKIISVTSQCTNEDMEKAKLIGIAAFLSKPARLEDVKKSLRRLSLLPKQNDLQDKILHVVEKAPSTLMMPSAFGLMKKSSPQKETGHYIDYSKLFNSLEENTTLCNDMLEQVAVDLEICLEQMANALTNKDMKLLAKCLHKAEGELSMILCPLGANSVRTMQASLSDPKDVELQEHFEKISEVFESIITEIGQLTTEEQLSA